MVAEFGSKASLLLPFRFGKFGYVRAAPISRGVDAFFCPRYVAVASPFPFQAWKIVEQLKLR